jgi:hypothetical protein
MRINFTAKPETGIIPSGNCTITMFAFHLLAFVTFIANPFRHVTSFLAAICRAYVVPTTLMRASTLTTILARMIDFAIKIISYFIWRHWLVCSHANNLRPQCGFLSVGIALTLCIRTDDLKLLLRAFKFSGYTWWLMSNWQNTVIDTRAIALNFVFHIDLSWLASLPMALANGFNIERDQSRNVHQQPISAHLI